MADPIPERAADRLIMDYPVDTSPAKTKKVVKGPKGKTPPPREEAPK